MTDASLTFRRARLDDVPAIVRRLADDPLGAKRERPEMSLLILTSGPSAPLMGTRTMSWWSRVRTATW